MKQIFFASYTYIFSHNSRLFDFFKHKARLFVILPKIWRSTKGNRQATYPWTSSSIRTVPATTIFYHSQYPVIRGMLKGWMPFLPGILLRRARIGDLLVSFYEPNLIVTLIYGLIANVFGLKHIFFTWQNVPFEQRLSGFKLRITDWLLRANFALSAGGVFGMERAREVHQKYISLNPKLKIAVIPQTGVDTDVFRPVDTISVREKYNLGDAPVFMYAATFTPRKGTMPTLNAFGQLAAIIPGVRFIVVGMGELQAQVEERIHRPDLDGRVVLLPWQKIEDLVPLYSVATALIHPSEPFEGWEEQFGLLILQAQACGTPVITTRTGSLEESVLHETTGLLVQPKDIDGMIQAMRRLHDDPQLHRRMSENARQYIVDHFSFDSVARRLESFFENI